MPEQIFLQNLPYELLEKIIMSLPTRSIISLLQTNKFFRGLLVDTFWKKKIKEDFNFTGTVSGGYYKKYVKFSETLCRKCYKKTTCVNFFYKVRLCRRCEQSDTVYETLTQTNIINNYFLNKKDIANTRFKPTRNRFNSFNHIKLYLKSDIIALQKLKYPSGLEILVKNKTDKKFLKIMKVIFKKNILDSIVLEYYDIDPREFSFIINTYTRGCYSRYLRSPKVDQLVLESILEKYIELDFISRFSTLEPPVSCIDFDIFLLTGLLFGGITLPVENYFIHTYILEKIKLLRETESSKFIRKTKVTESLVGFDYSYSETLIYEYIWNGVGEIGDIKIKLLEESFMINNMVFPDIMWRVLTSGLSKKEVYREEFIKYAQNGGILPDFIRKLHSI